MKHTKIRSERKTLNILTAMSISQKTHFQRSDNSSKQMSKSLNLGLLLICLMLINLITLSGVFASTTSVTALNVEFLSQNPDPVEPGNFVELRWRLTNNGGQAAAFDFELIPEYPFRLTDDAIQTKTITGFQGGTGSDILFYRVRVADDAIEGSQNKIKLAYRNKGSLTAEQIIVEVPIRIQSRKGLVEVASVNLNPDTIAIGSTFTAGIVVRNLGATSISNVKVTLDTEGTGFTPIGSSNQKIANIIPANGASEIQFEYFADGNTQVKVHAIPITIEYTDTLGRTTTQSTKIGFQIDATPSYLTNLEQTDILTANTKGRVVVSISNIGKSDLNFVVLELLESDDYVILSTPKSYLGNLQSDDFETGQYEIFVNPTSASEVPLKFRLYYRDAYDKTYMQDLVVDHRIFSKEEAKKFGLIKTSSGGVGFVIIVLVLIVGLIFWFRHKKKVQKK
jgi:hypothetical protein